MKPKVSIIIPVYNVEEYIENMLFSVISQDFKDFEVILINDGSTDRSGNIIDRFCEEDCRFRAIHKENGGVASARNRGIDEAKGEYVVFYDPDDYIPYNALGKMYRSAAKNHADIVVGVMEEKSLGESLIYMHSQKLAQQKSISPMDQHFFGAWSLCHKMFSLKLIRENNLRIEKLKNAEDGVFSFRALNCAKKICGCDVVAYNYIKRPFWLFPSATQTISSDYLEGLLSSHDRILEEAEHLADSRLSPTEKEEYLQKLYVRFIEGEMINGYYRSFWRSEQDLSKRIQERTTKYRKHITEKQWQEILNRGRDLDLEQGYKTVDELAAEPEISFLISEKLSERELNLAIGSIYHQNFLKFEVILPYNAGIKLDRVYREKKNFHIIPDSELKTKNQMLERAKGKYVVFVSEPVIYTKNTIKQMESVLYKKADLDFVSVLLKHYDGEYYKQIPVISAAYGYTKNGKSGYNKLTACDTFFSNKLIRKSSLQKFVFTENDILDVQALYRLFNFEKIRKGMMITLLTEKDILDRCKMKSLNFSIKANYLKNNSISLMIEKAKRRITREDIDKIKKKLGK